MTKKGIFISMLLTAMLSLTCVNAYADPTDILLQVNYVDPNNGGWKSGVYIVKAFIDDQELSEKIVIK